MGDINKKAQAAMEFLTTYGWAIVIILIIFSTLASLYVFKYQKCPQNFQIADDGFFLLDQKFMGSNSDTPEASNRFFIVLQNTPVASSTMKEITILKEGVECGKFSFPVGYTLSSSQKTNVLQSDLINPSCFGSVNSCYKYDVKIKYNGGVVGLLDKISSGYISGKFYGSGSYWNLGEFYSAYGSQIMQPRNGEKLNICIQEPPASSGSYIINFSGGTATWNLPLAETNCASTVGLVGQKGFNNVCGVDVPRLAKGWLNTTVRIDEIFSSSKIYLGGNAQYYDVNASVTKTNGICLNDNLYFHVNGVLKYYGGTTGKKFGNLSTYQTGDEIINNCGGCESVDTSRWCIPAFELTTAGFKFDEPNNVDILVEDYCFWLGEPHAGGMSKLSIKIV